MRRIFTEFLLKDREGVPPSALSDYDSLDVKSGGSRIYGQLLYPDGLFTAPRPCVIMFHGFPGSARNDDIAHALCRIGCVVLVPHNRGAWGSEGKYLVTNCIEDAKNLAAYVSTPEFCKKYNTDPSLTVLLGHSMGAHTAINAAKSLPDLRGIILMTPFDPIRLLEEGEEKLKDFLSVGEILNSDGQNALFENVYSCRGEIGVANSAPGVRNMNILLIGAEYDSIAPVSTMTMPLWDRLSSYESPALRELKLYPVQHGLFGCRIELISDIASFLSKICG